MQWDRRRKEGGGTTFRPGPAPPGCSRPEPSLTMGGLSGSYSRPLCLCVCVVAAASGPLKRAKIRTTAPSRLSVAIIQAPHGSVVRNSARVARDGGLD